MAFELIARGMAVGINLTLAIVLLRQFPTIASARTGAMFAVGVAAYALISAPQTAGEFAIWQWPLLVLAAGNNVVFWLFARTLFDDEFKPRLHHLLLWLGCVALSFVALGLFPVADGPVPDWALWIVRLVSVTLLIWVVVVAIHGRANDLIESRRFLRLALVVAVAVYATAILGHEALIGTAPAPWAAPVNAIGLALLSAIFATLLMRIDDAGLFVTATPSIAGRISAAPLDKSLMKRLAEIMAHDKPYREPGLSIGRLALRLDVPEYRLRQTINGALEHRNFSEFVNSYRLAECISALADAEQDDVPILTIALDAGFQSLATFNRTFRAATGLTPREYRARRARTGDILSKAKTD